MTLLEFINKFVFQLFFVRIAKYGEMKEGAFITKGYKLMYFIVPFTGWSNNYKSIGKIGYLKLFDL